MRDELRQLDALVVDVEDSTTLLKLYIGRLTKTPSRAIFYPPVVEHSEEIAAAVAALHPALPGRGELLRIAGILTALAHEFDSSRTATLTRILTMQEAVDLLEAQLDDMLQGQPATSPEIALSLERIEASARISPPPAEAHGGLPEHERATVQGFEDDPFDEFALSEDFLDELVGGFDAALEASITSGRGRPAPRSVAPAFDPGAVEPGPVRLSAAEEEALKELFAQIASSYVAPIRDFISKLRIGPVTTGWIELCLPAVESMERASRSMGYSNLCEALRGFEAALREVSPAGRVIDGDRRARVLAAYQQLAEILPTTFPFGEAEASAESEAIILNSLLKQIKGVGRVTISRLFSAGLVSLEAYYLAEPDELAAAAGLRPRLAARICERLHAYRDQSMEAEDEASVLQRLAGLVSELRGAQFEFKKATLDEWYTHQPSRAKAKARRVRQQTMWKVNVVLAELGAVDFIREIKDDIYDKRLAKLEAYLARRADRREAREA